MFRFGVSRTIAVSLLALMLLLILIVPLMPFYDPYTQDLGGSLLPIGGKSFDGKFYLLWYRYARP